MDSDSGSDDVARPGKRRLSPSSEGSAGGAARDDDDAFPRDAAKLARRSADSGSDDDATRPPPLRCAVTPACLRLGAFPSPAFFEAHVLRFHTNVCSACRRLLPTPHLLALHVEECHDSFFAARAARGDRCYACLAPSCAKKFRDPARRRRHAMDKHGYPKEYNWGVVLGVRQRDGVAGTASEFGGTAGKVGAATPSGWKSKGGSKPRAMDVDGGAAAVPDGAPAASSSDRTPAGRADGDRPEADRPANPSPTPSPSSSDSEMDLTAPLTRLQLAPRPDVMKRKGRGAHAAFYHPRAPEEPPPRAKEEGWGDGKIAWAWGKIVPRSVAMKKKGEAGKAGKGADGGQADKGGEDEVKDVEME